MDELKKKTTKTPLITTPVAIVIAGAIIAGAILFSETSTLSGNNKGTTADQGPSQKELLKTLKIQESDHVRGDKNAEVYIVEYSDTECPYCKNFHGTMKQIMAEYPNVAWVYRHFPLASLHPTAPREAEALECANELGGEETFWTYTDTVYERTPGGGKALTDENLSSFAVELGIDKAKFEECLNSGKYTNKISKSIQEALDTGGRGTPHSFIVGNGEAVMINGAQPYNVVKASLEKVLE